MSTAVNVSNYVVYYTRVCLLQCKCWTIVLTFWYLDRCYTATFIIFEMYTNMWLRKVENKALDMKVHRLLPFIPQWRTFCWRTVILSKVGSYGLMRFTLTLFPVGYSYWSCFIFVVSLFGSYLGSINCLTIYDIKQIIAYSSITHMNLAVADLFTLNIYGLQGSLVTSLAHGLSSSGLFCSVGFI